MSAAPESQSIGPEGMKRISSARRGGCGRRPMHSGAKGRAAKASAVTGTVRRARSPYTSLFTTKASLRCIGCPILQRSSIAKASRYKIRAVACDRHVSITQNRRESCCRVKEQLNPELRIHVAAAEVKFWESPDFSHVSMPAGFPDALRAAAKRCSKDHQSQLRLFENEHEVAPGVVVSRTGGHTPGAGSDRRTAGGNTYAVSFCWPCRGRR
jgi:hypothetical protein